MSAGEDRPRSMIYLDTSVVVALLTSESAPARPRLVAQCPRTP